MLLDMDLAKIYEVETRALKQSVRRNIDRFPQDFMFQLTEIEMQNLVSQNVIPHMKYFGGTAPFISTEQGVAMLSSILKSKKAIQINIAIMRAFVMIGQWALTYQELSDKLSALEQQYNQKFNDIDQVLKYLLQKDQTKIKPIPREKVGYKK